MTWHVIPYMSYPICHTLYVPICLTCIHVPICLTCIHVIPYMSHICVCGNIGYDMWYPICLTCICYPYLTDTYVIPYVHIGIHVIPHITTHTYVFTDTCDTLYVSHVFYDTYLSDTCGTIRMSHMYVSHTYTHVANTSETYALFLYVGHHNTQIYLYTYTWDLCTSHVETWGAGVDIHTVDTRPSPFQFRNHFLVRLVPSNLPLPCADQMVLNDM